MTPLPISPPSLRLSCCRLFNAVVAPAPPRRCRRCPGSAAAVPKPSPLRPLPLPPIWLSHLSCLPLSPLVLPPPPSLPPPYHHRRRCCCLSAAVIAVALVPPPITKQGPLRVAIHCIRHFCLPPLLPPPSHRRRRCLTSAAISVALALGFGVRVRVRVRVHLHRL